MHERLVDVLVVVIAHPALLISFSNGSGDML
jgi:hypothetical protein